jgi:hypothetical protein
MSSSQDEANVNENNYRNPCVSPSPPLNQACRFLSPMAAPPCPFPQNTALPPSPLRDDQTMPAGALQAWNTLHLSFSWRSSQSQRPPRPKCFNGDCICGTVALGGVSCFPSFCFFSPKLLLCRQRLFSLSHGRWTTTSAAALSSLLDIIPPLRRLRRVCAD